jgi:hypothetical protein
MGSYSALLRLSPFTTSMNNLAECVGKAGQVRGRSHAQADAGDNGEGAGVRASSTLISMSNVGLALGCLAHLLVKRDCYKESLALYDRACAGYDSVFGEDHPTTRACCRHRSEAVASQEQTRAVFSPAMTDNSTSIHSGTASMLSRDGRTSLLQARTKVERDRMS